MSKPTDPTTAQALFLRAFRDNPAGPPPESWPSPGTFRRWLKKESFRAALAAIRDALRFQADIHVATAAAQAAKNLQAALPTASPLDPDAAAHITTQLKAITDLLRLAHLRQRFADEIPTATPAPTTKPGANAPLSADPMEALRQIASRFEGQNGAWAILNDAQRLMCYIYLHARDHAEYDQFLLAHPDKLEDLRTRYPNRPAAPQT